MYRDDSEIPLAPFLVMCRFVNDSGAVAGLLCWRFPLQVVFSESRKIAFDVYKNIFSFSLAAVTEMIRIERSGPSYASTGFCEDRKKH